MNPLDQIPVLRLASEAHRLARCGQITGEAALSLIIWPDQLDMHRYLNGQTNGSQDPDLDELLMLTPIEQQLLDPDVELAPVIRLYHTYMSGLPGMCQAMIKIGYRTHSEHVRCSRRATVDGYCRTHAKTMAAA